MSAPVMALGAAAFEGVVAVRELAPRTMITLRGDLASAKMAAAVQGCRRARRAGRLGAVFGDETAALWMSPDELFLIRPRATGRRPHLRRPKQALAGSHHPRRRRLRRAVGLPLEGEGAHVRDVLAKLSLADVHPESFPPAPPPPDRATHPARGKVPAAFWMQDDASAEVVAFRSVAAYVFGLLKTAAEAGPAGHFR